MKTISDLLKWTRGAAALLAAVTAVPTYAGADAATHQLSIKASTISADCGPDGCSRDCSVRAVLKNVGHRKSPEIAVRITYVNHNTDAGQDEITLEFPPLAVKASAKSLDESHGYECKKVKVKSITVDCPMEDNEKCPGFFYVQIPDVPVLGIKRQKIEGK